MSAPNAPQVDDLPADWPHRSHSRMLAAAGQRWHVQELGSGPAVLLIHGAGGSLHSWRDLSPLLAPQFRVIAIDIAGHGYSQKTRFIRAGLNDIAQDIAALARQQNWPIRAMIGHSAGAAIALRLAQILPLEAVIGLNAALSNFEGVAGWLFPAMAKSLSRLPFAAQVVSKFLGHQGQIDQLLAQTGAQISAAGRGQYLTLARRPAHIAATLDMMAAWDLSQLLPHLPQITVPCLLLTGSQDGAVPHRVSFDAARALPHAKAQLLHGYGHLIAEEAAAEIAPLITDFLAQHLPKAP